MSLCDKIKQYLAEGWKLVDVRTPGEYAQGHIENAELVPMQEVPSLGEGKYLLYCRSGARSGSAAAYLESKGIQAINIGGVSQYIGCLEY
jgi:rhodanese-related sulfurtransferase